MKNTDNISLDSTWWKHKDHKLTTAIDEKDRKIFLNLLESHDKLKDPDYKNWVEIVTKCKSIAKIAYKMRTKSGLSSSRHKQSIEALQIIETQASGRAKLFEGYASFVKDQAKFFSDDWAIESNLSNEPFKTYFKYRKQEDEYNWYAKTVDARDSIGMREDILFLRTWLNLAGPYYKKLENAFAERRSGRVGVPKEPDNPDSPLNIEASKKLWEPAVKELKTLLNQVWKRKSDRAEYLVDVFLEECNLKWHKSEMRNYSKVPGV